jgi:hypothetical protein
VTLAAGLPPTSFILKYKVAGTGIATPCWHLTNQVDTSR